MPRFVVLRHELPPQQARPSHWDLMLERDGVLRTWALETLPNAEETQPADALADHRLAYLEYEGPVSGDRGTVMRWDKGEYETVEERPMQICVHLRGERWQGKLTLQRTDADAQRWLCSFLAD
jgi:hypothetical protein